MASRHAADGARRRSHRERIVEAAVELLDTAGEAGLTFRALTERLDTGAGAIYWHVANKGELLDAATDGVIAAALAVGPPARRARRSAPSRSGCSTRSSAHPWLATQLAPQLSRSPWGSVTPRIFEGIGRQVRALGVPEATCSRRPRPWCSYILGAAGQNAANVAGARASKRDRAEFLDAVVDGVGGARPGGVPVHPRGRGRDARARRPRAVPRRRRPRPRRHRRRPPARSRVIQQRKKPDREIHG